MPRCIVCGKTVESWLPHPLVEHRSEFMVTMRAVGSDLSIFQCPSCGCNDRDRHLWLFMHTVGLLEQINRFRVLHIAPEQHLELLISRLEPVEYVRGDLFPKSPQHLKLDIENLAFEAGRFELIICNHVLEHVADPVKAVSELYRCLAPRGILIAQTPYSPYLKKTLEVNEPVSPEFAKLFYGQEDHVRLFGADIAELFVQAGFAGAPLPSESVLGPLGPLEYGFNALEPFFVFNK